MEYDSDFIDSYLELPWVKIHYKRHVGPGSSVIFLHGLGVSEKTWKRAVQWLPETWNIYLIDLVGHGLSGAPEIEYNVAMQGRMLEEFVSEEGLESYSLVGHSYGGWVAASYSQRKRYGGKLVLEDSAGLLENVEENRRVDPRYKERIYSEAIRLNPNARVIGGTVSSFGRGEELTSEALGRIGNGTLVVWGSDDKVIDAKYARLFSEKIPGSSLEVIDLGGHTPHYYRPRIFAEAVSKFIDGE